MLRLKYKNINEKKNLQTFNKKNFAFSCGSYCTFAKHECYLYYFQVNHHSVKWRLPAVFIFQDHNKRLHRQHRIKQIVTGRAFYVCMYLKWKRIKTFIFLFYRTKHMHAIWYKLDVSSGDSANGNAKWWIKYSIVIFAKDAFVQNKCVDKPNHCNLL